MIRAGVVGLGFGARGHVPGLRLVDGVHVVAVCARRGAAEAARELGVEHAYGDWRRLLDEPGLGLVTIATPPATHREIALAALERGLPVLCEKPLGATLEDARRLAAAAAAAGIPTLVDFEFRAVPAFARAHDLLRERRYGTPRHVAVTWALGTRAAGPLPPGWKDDVALGGGALLNLGTHVFDYLEWLVGRVERAEGEVARQEGGLSDTGFRADLELAGGATASVVVTTAASDPTGHAVRIECERGAIEIENSDTTDYMRGFSLRAPGVSLGPVGGAADGRIAPFAILAGRLVEAIRSGGSAEPSFAHGLRAHEVAAAIASGGHPNRLPL